MGRRFLGDLMRLGMVKVALTTLAAGVASLVLASNAGATGLDCRTGCNGFLGGALFMTTGVGPTGSGVIDSFVRIDGQNVDAHDGHNTSGPFSNDEKPGNFTHNIKLGSVPILNIGGILYYEFLLDINEPSADKKSTLSLNAVQICTSDTGSLTKANGCPSSGGVNTALKYTLGAYNDGTSDVLMDFDYNGGGSGSADLFMYIPVYTIGVDPNKYVYLWSQFGVPVKNDGNYEEWAVRICGNEYGGKKLVCLPPPPNIPEPSSMILLGTGMVGLAAVLRRRSRNAAVRN